MLCRWSNLLGRSSLLLFAVIIGCANAPGNPTSFSQKLALGGTTSCLIDAQYNVECWGEGSEGQLGGGLLIDTFLPQHISSPQQATTAMQLLTVGGSHSCGATINGALFCWGAARSGQLGLGDRERRLLPAPLSAFNGMAPESRVRLVAAGKYHSCAITEDEHLFCWGFSGNGQLGNGHIDSDTSTYLSPVEITALPYSAPIKALALGGYHSCALHTHGTVSCWGHAGRGQLGNECSFSSLNRDGCQNDQARPVALPYFDLASSHRSAQALMAGEYHTCAITHSDHLVCWGDNSSGQLGVNSRFSSSRPTLVHDIDNVMTMALGSRHSCAIRHNGALYCWGANNWGQLGIQSSHSRLVPVAVLGFNPDNDERQALQVESGDYHTCAIDDHQQLWCWGANQSGQAGHHSQRTILASPQLVRQL